VNEKTGEMSYGFASNLRDALPNASPIWRGSLVGKPTPDPSVEGKRLVSGEHPFAATGAGRSRPAVSDTHSTG
jgi:hypothetical protein